MIILDHISWLPFGLIWNCLPEVKDGFAIFWKMKEILSFRGLFLKNLIKTCNIFNMNEYLKKNWPIVGGFFSFLWYGLFETFNGHLWPFCNYFWPANPARFRSSFRPKCFNGFSRTILPFEGNIPSAQAARFAAATEHSCAIRFVLARSVEKKRRR